MDKSLLSMAVPTLGVITLSTFLAACGGGGGNSGGGGGGVVAAGVGTVSGVVAGTTVIAVDSTGDIVATDDTAGRIRDVDTDSDGIPDAFSFTLQNLPLTEDIRVYLVTGGGIFPLYFDTDNDGISDSNVFALGADATTPIALGFIDVTLEDGRAIPTNNPVDDSDVTAEGEIAEIPSGVNEPPTTGMTVAELNIKGNDALQSGWILGAKAYYQAAVDLGGNDNDADIARFMLALLRAGSLGFDTLSDDDAQDMTRLGDFLDLFGVVDDGNRANLELIEEPLTLPDDSPTGSDLSDYLYNVVRVELLAAATDLDAVSNTFATRITDDDGENTDVDYGDVLFCSGLFRLVAASIEIQRAYNVDVDIDSEGNNDSTAEDIQNNNAGLLGQPDLARLAEAKASLTAALVDMNDAIDAVEAETDDQTDDLVTLATTGAGATADDWRLWISQTQASIGGGDTTIRRAAIDLQTFFDSGVVLDDTTLPGLAGNDIDPTDGFFDDALFGGVIEDLDINTDGIQDLNIDADLDGIADIAQ